MSVLVPAAARPALVQAAESASMLPLSPPPVRRHEENPDVRYRVSSFTLLVLLIVDQFVPIEIARERNGATLVPEHENVVTIAPRPSARRSMSAGHMGVPIRRADLTDEIGLMADMLRPCGKLGRDSLACRLVGRSLPHTRNTLDEAPPCQSYFL